MSIPAITREDVTFLDEDDWVSCPDTPAPGAHNGVTCRDADALAHEVANEYLATRERAASLEAMVDELRSQLRTAHATNELLAEQNEMLTEEVLISAPMDAAISVHLSRDEVRTIWREVRPGSRGPAPAATIDSLQDAHDEIHEAVINAARAVLHRTATPRG